MASMGWKGLRYKFVHYTSFECLLDNRFDMKTLGNHVDIFLLQSRTPFDIGYGLDQHQTTEVS
jgi:hypothetical protein